MSLHLQSKLLRVLEEEEVQPIGDNKSIPIDVRIIAATNKDLEEEIKKGNFREDLYHRLNVVKIKVPPLRERKEDILPISYLFLRKFTESYNKRITSFDTNTESFLKNNPWQGNVRELRNFIERLVLFTKSEEVKFNTVLKISKEKDRQEKKQSIENFKEAKDNFEKEHIIAVLNKHEWKIIETAEALDINRTHLFKKMKYFGIEK